MTLNIAFAGFRHGHIFDLYNRVSKHTDVNLIGAWENDAETRNSLDGKVDFNFSTYEEILADERVDIVAIGDYYGIRGKLVIEALKAGKHVITDKPLCTSLDELDEIERLASEKNLIVHCMFSMRYEANIVALKSLIESGKLGEITNVYFGGQHPLNYGVRPMWYFEDGKHGGTINDIAIHGIDIIKYAMNLRPTKILAARCWNKYATEAKNFKDSAQFMLELENGAGVIADVSYAAVSSQSLPTYWGFIVWGTKGMAKFSYGTNIDLYLEGEKQPQIVEGIKTESDYFTDMIAELEGKCGLNSTADVISASRDTLNIQMFAEF